jgi:hypothetical protein
MGLRVTPSAVAYPSTHNYIDTMTIAYNQSLRKPQVDGKIVRPFGNDYISGWLESMGQFAEVQGLEYFHVEKDRIKEIIKGTCTAVGANAAVVFTIGSSYRGSVAQNATPYINTTSDTAYPVRKNDVLLFPDGTQGKVTSAVNGSHQFTVYPMVLGESIPTVTATEEIVILSNLSSEFSNARTSYNTKTWTYKNQITRHRDDHRASATAMAEVTWLNNLGENGNESKWYLEAVHDTYKNVMTDCEQFMVIGDEITNTTLADVDSNEGQMTASRGLITDITTYGNVETYSAGSFALTDLENMGKNLVQNKGARENTLWCGYTLKVELDNLFRTSTGLTSGGTIYSSAAGSAFGEARRVAFEFDHVSYGGFKYFIKQLDMFDNPQGLGAVGQTYTNMGVLIPADNMVPEQFQGNSSIGVPSLRLRYLNEPQSTRGYREWVTGGSPLANPTDDSTEAVFHFTINRGLEASALSRFGLFTV